MAEITFDHDALATALVLSGTYDAEGSSATLASVAVSVTFDGVVYTGLATVAGAAWTVAADGLEDADGNALDYTQDGVYSDISFNAFLSDGTTLTDNSPASVTVDGTGPVVEVTAITVVDGDTIVDLAAEDMSINAADADLIGAGPDAVTTISGTAVDALAGVPVGTTVTVTIEGSSYTTTTTDAAGNWTLDVPIANLQSIAGTAGDYNITATVADVLGTSTTSTAQTLTVDLTAPVAPSINLADASDTGSTTDDNITSDLTPTIDGTAAGAEGGLVQLFTQASGTGALVALGDPIAVADDGTWTVDLADGLLPEGTHILVAAAQDAAGNGDISTDATVLSTELEITLDASVAPVIDSIAVTATGEAATTGNDDEVTLAGTAVAGEEVTITVTNDDDNRTADVTATADASGAWTIDVVLDTLFPEVDLNSDGDTDDTDEFAAGPDATYSFTASSPGTTEDSATLDYALDRTAPTNTIVVTDISDDSGAADGVTSDNTLTITGTVSADATLTVTITPSTGAPIILEDVLATVAGGWTVDVKDENSVPIELADGDYVITAAEVDAAGNASTSAPFDVTIDTAAPASVAIVSMTQDTGAASDDFITSDTTLIFEGTAEAGSTVQVAIDGTDIGSPITVGANGSWILNHTTTTLAEGEFVVTATATDGAGNETVASQDLVIDTTAPELTVSPISEGTITLTEADTINADGLTIAGTSTGIPEGETITVVVTGTGDAADATYNPAVNASGAWSIDIPAADLNLAGGENVTVTANYTDAAGNAATEATATAGVGTPAVTITAEDTEAGGTADTDSDVTGTGDAVANVVEDDIEGLDRSGSITLSDVSGDETITVTQTAGVEAGALTVEPITSGGVVTWNYAVTNAELADLNFAEVAQTYVITVSEAGQTDVTYEVNITLETDETGQLIIGGDEGGDLTGGTGEDVIIGGDGVDNVAGGDSFDYVDGGAGADVIDGGAGGDVLFGGADNDEIDGGAGADYIDGGAGEDTIDAGADNDVVYGGDDGDTLSGGAGSDFVYGDAGVDTLNGGADQDFLYGGVGADTLNGDDGSDFLFGGDDADTLNGGEGQDYLFGDAGADTLNGEAGDDFLFGSNDSNTMNGGDGDDYMFGEAGDETMNGGAGTDVVFTGDGNDTVNGGAGQDYLYSEGGSNTFVMTTGQNNEVIYDFSAVDDKILVDVDGLDSFADLESSIGYDAASNTTVVVADDTVMILVDFNVDDLTADNFDFG